MHIIHATDIKSPFSVAIVASRFNTDVTELLFKGAIERLHELGLDNEHILAAWVPGAVELPIVAQKFASLGRVAAVICLGAVIRGETTHYDYVCDQVSYGCQRVALDSRKPIIFGVLTTDNDTQALERAGGKMGHKGREAADCAYEMISVLHQIS